MVLGIDGLGIESMKTLKLSRLEHRMKGSLNGIPEIDNVVSRGWPEIYTGETAYKSGAFYQIPIMHDKKIRITQQTGLDRIKAHISQEKLLWNALNNYGLSCGVFGVPTTSTAQKIDGFFVAATGAGKFGNSMNEGDFYPKNLLDGLTIKELDLGLRMGYGTLIPKSLEELEERANKHLSDYFYLLEVLLERHQPDTCFVATRFVNEMAYKFIKLCQVTPNDAYENRFKKLVLNLADNFDILLDKCINNISPNHLFVVSDHGIGLFEYHVNLNEMLHRVGVLNRSHTKNLIKKIINLRTQYLPYKRRRIFYPGYQLEKSDAFSVGFSDLIYLNDERFTGPQMDIDQTYEKSLELEQHLNEYSSKIGYSDFFKFDAIKKDKYTKPILKKNHRVPIPNIRCYLKQGYSNTQRTNNEILVPNICSFSKKLFIKGFHGEYSGCKTDDTLAIYSGDRNDLVDLSRLTNIYDSIISVIKSMT